MMTATGSTLQPVAHDASVCRTSGNCGRVDCSPDAGSAPAAGASGNSGCGAGAAALVASMSAVWLAYAIVAVLLVGYAFYVPQR